MAMPRRSKVHLLGTRPVLMKNAVNTEQAHELANTFRRWKVRRVGQAPSSNPVGKGAAEKLNPDVSAYYNAAR
jgi:hypothetical protein